MLPPEMVTVPPDEVVTPVVLQKVQPIVAVIAARIILGERVRPRFALYLGPALVGAWLIGVPWKDCIHIGNLLGTRMVINELVAFSQLGPMAGTIDPRSFTIATFALCGFANFSSIGIQLGGIGALAPNKKEELAKLGFRAMLAGTAANLISAAIVGMLV